ncbi:MAG: glycosyltransferase [Bacteroidetes bacterium]|nr:glycosyltransferase [Bacteroidota bacterium]
MEENKKLVVISSPVAGRSGYSSHSRDIIRSLIRIHPDWDIKLISTKWGSCPLNALSEPADNDLISRLMFQQMNKQPDIWIQITIPSEFQRVGKWNCGITAAIETNIADPSWIEGANKMDLVITTSKHSKSTLADVGYDKMDSNTKKKIGEIKLNKPISVLFEGIDTNIYKKTKEISKELKDELKQIPEKFLFCFCGHWLSGITGQDRKNVGMLIHTFCEAFKSKQPQNRPGLLLKTSGATFSAIDRTEMLEKIDNIRKKFNYDTPNIYLLHGDLTDQEMNSLYNCEKVKVHITFTRGEGFGRPLLEASVSGKPIIASGWSGQLDFLNPNYTTLLPGTLTDVHPSAFVKNMIIKGSKWFTVDYNEAKRIMLDIYKRYDSYLELSQKNTAYSSENFSLEVMDKVFKNILDKHINLPTEMKLNLPKLNMKKEEPKEFKIPKLKKM